MEDVNYNKNHYDAYQRGSDNVGHVQQVVMLYDGAINFIKQAKEALIAKNFEGRYNLLNKAVAIITGLNSCLNFTDETEETSKVLDDFYRMMDMRLLYMMSDDKTEPYDKIVEELKQMRDAWADVAKQTAEASFKSKGNDVLVSEEITDVKESDIIMPAMQGNDVNPGDILSELQISA